jgi:hypothetical protein
MKQAYLLEQLVADTDQDASISLVAFRSRRREPKGNISTITPAV